MSAPAPTGTYNIVSAINPRLAVTIIQSSNNQVFCTPMNNGPTQQWTITIVSGNIVNIVNQATNLAIFAPRQSPGTPVVGGPTGPSPSQWQFNSIGQNQYVITTVSGPKLALTSRSTTDPSPLTLNPFSVNDPLQKWTLVLVSTGGSA